MNKPVVLSGFSGAGKSTVGRILKNKYGWKWVDIDAEVEKTSGRTIAQLVSEEGEQRFRELEAELVRKAFDGAVDVISLGGGALLDSGVASLIAERGVLVCLRVSAAASARRVYLSEQAARKRGKGTVRPLLAAGDAGHEGIRQRVEELMERRKGLYDRALITIDTEGRSGKQVAEALVEALARNGIEVKPSQ